MSPEKEEQIRSKLIQRIVGGVSFAEIVKILHELATREVNFQLSGSTEDEKNELYKELFEARIESDSNQLLLELPSKEAPAV